MKRLLINTCLLIFGLVVGLGLLEVLVRLFNPQVLYNTENFFQGDSIVGYRYKSNMDSRMSSPDYDVPFVTNSVGMRDRPFALAKPQGVFRILNLGDSFGVGHGIRSEETYSKVLEELLNDSADSTKCEVINASVGGYDPRMELRYLNRYGMLYQPDLVVLGFYVGNDFISDTSPQYVAINGNLYNQESAKEIDGTKGVRQDILPIVFKRATLTLRSFLGSKSHLYILLRRLMDTYLYRHGFIGIYANSIDIFLADPNVRVTQTYQSTLNSLHAINDSCRSRNIPFIILLIPTVFQVHEEDLQDKLITAYGIDTTAYDFQKPQRLIQNSFASDPNIMVIDVMPAMKEKSKEVRFYHPRDNHWNAAGHLLAAKEILEVLKTRKKSSRRK